MLQDLLFISFVTGKTFFLLCLSLNHLLGQQLLNLTIHILHCNFFLSKCCLHCLFKNVNICSLDVAMLYRNFVAFSHILRDMLNGLSWLVLTQLIFWTVSNAKIFITHRWVRIKLCCCEIEIFLRSIMLSLLLMLTAWCWK